MKSSRILVVEDEGDLRSLIALHLEREGAQVSVAEDGECARRLIRENSGENSYDVLVLDWMLPGVSGLELCAEVQRSSLAGRAIISPGILMVTARADAADIVRGLEAGADDYVTKPFELKVLLARVSVLLRRRAELVAFARGEGGPPSAQLELGALRINTETFEASQEGRPLALTRSEFKLLQVLVRSPGKVYSRGQLIDLVQGEDVSVVDRSIDTHVFGLRRKLGASADLIETIRGVGYRVRSESP